MTMPMRIKKWVISAVGRCANPYGDWDRVLEPAGNGDLKTIVPGTTEAGIVYDPESAFDQVL